jgi:hypothetical protein
MQTQQADYFSAYRTMKMTRDAKGVLVVEFPTRRRVTTSGCSSRGRCPHRGIAWVHLVRA